MMSRRFLSAFVAAFFGLAALGVAPWQASARYPTPDTQHLTPYTPAVIADPADWPMYGHDPQRTNYNPAETTISAATVSSLVQRWTFNLGNSSPTSGAPSVSNGRLYAGSSITSGNNFFAINAITGAQVWATSVGHGTNCFSVGIGSGSVVSGTVLSVGGGDQAFYGLNADTGAQLWREPMNVGTSGFPWSSPLLTNGRSYLGMASCADNPSVRGEVRAVDMESGANDGSQYFVPAGNGGAGIWSSPALSPDGSALVVATGEDYGGYNGPYNRAIVSLDPITLAILQSNQQGTTGGDLDYAATPLFFSDSLGRTLVGGLHKNGTFYAYELSTINNGPIWSRSVGGYSAGMMPAYDPNFGAGGTLFVTTSGRVYAMDPQNGQDRWPFLTLSGLHGNIALANGLLFANSSGNLQIRDEVNNGTLLRTITPVVTGSTYTGPIVSHGFVYWLSGGWINAWSLPDTITPTATPSLEPATSTPTLAPTNTNLPTNTPQPTTTNTAPPTATRTRTATSTASATGTHAATSTATRTSTAATRTSTRTSTAVSTSTQVGPTETASPISTNTPIEATLTATLIVATATPCTITFADVPPVNTFYPFIRCLACRGIISGYDDGTFRFNNPITRGQIAKIVSNAAGFFEDAGPQIYEDVDSTNTFYVWINRLSNRGFMGGYPCGTIPEEPCNPPADLPYFRPFSNATRGQLAKIVSNAAGLAGTPTGLFYTDVPEEHPFYVWIMRLTDLNVMSGYPCGSNGEPCDSEQRPYFRPFANVTRGQASKIVANTFYPNCQTPSR